MAEKYYPFAGQNTFFLSDYTRDASYVASSVSKDAKLNEAAGLIDPLNNLKNMPVYILSNTEDTQVPPAMHDAQKMFYDTFESNVQFVQQPWEHNWPTDIPESVGLEFRMELKADCTIKGGRRVYNCGYDTAGDILRHTLPNIDGSVIEAKDNDWMSKGVLQKFD